MSQPSTSKVPLSITLITSNMSLLCDDDMDGAHKAAMTSFWNRIRPFFHKRIVHSIELEVVRVGTVVFAQAAVVGEESSEKKDSPSINTPTLSNLEEDSDNDANTRRAQDSLPMDGDEMSDSDGKDSGVENNSIHVARCVQQIQHYIAELADADFKVNRAREVSAMPVSVSVALMESTNRDFGILARRWLSQIMSPTNLKGSFAFELPEAMDGTQCSIVLDAKYRALPYAADSPAAAGLLADLKWMSSCTMEVVQLVPISCVDANLLFGVSMEVTPAFQNDVNRYKEMKALAHALFHQLREKDVALLLQAKDADEILESGFGPPLHHTSHQTFLLMTQDVSTCAPGFEASLFRYVNADQLLSVGSIELYTPSDDELTESITAYVECALEMLPNNLINPLVNDEVRILREIERMAISDSIAMASPTKAMEIDEEGAWTDASGVGSLVQPEAVAISEPVIKVSQTAAMQLDGEEAWADTSGVGSLVHREAVSPVEKVLTTEGDMKAHSGAPAMVGTAKEATAVDGLIALSNTSSDGLDEVVFPPLVDKESLQKKAKKKRVEKCSTQHPVKSVKRHKLKMKTAFASRSTPKEIIQAPTVSINLTLDSTDDISEVAPTIVTSLLSRRMLSGPLTLGSKSKSIAACDDSIASQLSVDEICEFPATSKETNTLDQLTATQEQALGQILFEEDSDDDDWKGHAGVGFRNKTVVDLPHSARLKCDPADNSSSSDDEISAGLAKRLSFQRAASVFMDALTDTDSDPEFS